MTAWSKKSAYQISSKIYNMHHYLGEQNLADRKYAIFSKNLVPYILIEKMWQNILREREWAQEETTERKQLNIPRCNTKY